MPHDAGLTNMSAEKTTAIVLKTVGFSETSCVVTLLTRDFGKISALAKGAFRRKSPFEGALDVLACCRVVFLRKSLDSLDLLTEAKLLRRFRSSSRDLSRWYASLYVVELITSFTEQGESQPELYDLVNSTIESLDHDGVVPTCLLQFELRLLTILGQNPGLSRCVDCDRILEPQARLPFSYLLGGALCSRCRSGQRGVVSLKRETVDIMKQLTSRQTPCPEIDWTLAVQGELRGLLDQYISDLLGRRPRMYPYVREIFRTRTSR